MCVDGSFGEGVSDDGGDDDNDGGGLRRRRRVDILRSATSYPEKLRSDPVVATSDEYSIESCAYVSARPLIPYIMSAYS